MLIEWLTITLIASLGIISPGSGFAVAFRNSLSYGCTVGLGTAWGIACGDFIHVLINLLGVAALLTCYPKITSILQLSGGLYLLYLGIKGMYSKCLDISVEEHLANRSCASGFFEGLLITVLNPKALLFWLGIFSVIIPPATSFVLRLCIGGWIAVLSLSWFAFVALCVTQQSFNQFFQQHMKCIERVISIVLILIALKVLILTDIKILLDIFGYR